MKKNLPQKKKHEKRLCKYGTKRKKHWNIKILKKVEKENIEKKEEKKNVYNIELINLVINHDTVFSVASKRYISRERK